jgi:hypothetical protein
VPSTRTLKVKITGDERDLSRSLGKTQSATSKWSRSLATFGKAAALGLAGVGVAAVKFGIDFVDAAEESVKIGKQTAAVIKSTGGVAKVTATEVSNLAEKLSLKAGVDDELIQSGENVLLTFTNIRNEVGKGNDIFDQATTLALDMSVALGTDLQGSVLQVGKALNDPIKGIAALTRVGVTFTDQQKEQIRTLVESGDTLGAQRVILAELTKEFGGSAEAQASASDRLRVAFGNISEEIGMVLLPYVNQFSDWLAQKGIPLIRDHFVPWLRDELIPALSDFAHWVKDEIVPGLAKVGPIVRDDIVPAVQALAEALAALPGWVQVALGALAVLARFGGFGVLVGAVKGFGIAVAGVAYAVVSTLFTAFTLIGSFGGLMFAGLIVAGIKFRNQIGAAFLWVRDRAVGAFRELRDRAVTNIQGIASKIAALPGQVAGALGRLANLFGDAMSSAWRQVIEFRDRIVDAIRSIPGRIGSLGGKIRDAIVGGIGKIDLSPGFDIPGVPFLQHGGIVTRPTLAVVGEAGPEAVVPLRRELGGPIGMGAGGGTTVINLDMRGSVVPDARDPAFQRLLTRTITEALGRDTGAITVQGSSLVKLTRPRT